MDPSTCKIYQKHDFSGRDILDGYTSPKSDKLIFEHICLYPMKMLHAELAKGNTKGHTLIDISFGPIISHLLPVCEFFQEIIILEHSDSCIKELKKWINKEPDAFDWSHASTFVSGLEGKSNQSLEKEESLRRKVKSIMKCDLDKENPTDPIELPKADCLLSVHGLGVFSKDKDSYCRYLKNISSLLKLGGHLCLMGGFNTPYLKIGEHNFRTFMYNKEFVMKAVREAGYAVEMFDVKDCKINHDLICFESVFFLKAIKQKEI